MTAGVRPVNHYCATIIIVTIAIVTINAAIIAIIRLFSGH